MNKIFRVKYNRAKCDSQVTSELGGGRRGGSSNETTDKRKSKFLLSLALAGAISIGGLTELEAYGAGANRTW